MGNIALKMCRDTTIEARRAQNPTWDKVQADSAKLKASNKNATPNPTAGVVMPDPPSPNMLLTQGYLARAQMWRKR